MHSTEEKSRPTITSAPNGPYIVKGLKSFRNSKGELESKPQMALCRCGESSNKPFCDGAHAGIGFTDAKHDDRVEDRREDYAGAKITIHDNRSICSHAGICTDELATVFRLGEEPWIDPNGADAEQMIATINKCPSGALSYSIDGVEHRDENCEPSITVAKNGPYVVTGDLELVGVSLGQDASKEQVTLCRCGGSKNKPFCDGAHWQRNFTDDES